MFILVRSTNILVPFISGNADLFRHGYFDAFYVFNEEHWSGNGAVAGLSVTFVNVSEIRRAFPAGFNSVLTEAKWGYCQMIRFFWKSVFELPQIALVSKSPNLQISKSLRLDGTRV
jgi:hypothetical protein